MTIVSNQTRITLQPGETLTVTADANSSGLVRRHAPSGQLTGAQIQTVPASSSRVFGTFPTPRHYSIEASVGFLTYIVEQDECGYATQKVNVEVFTGDRTLRSEDNGKVLRCDDGSAVIVTVPSDVPLGFNATVVQWGAGVVSIAAGSGATSRSGAVDITDQYKSAQILMLKAAEYIVTGATEATPPP